MLPSKSQKLTQPQKKDLNDRVILVPVHRDDFKKINEFAEAAWICREPGNSEVIKETRRSLLREVFIFQHDPLNHKSCSTFKRF